MKFVTIVDLNSLNLNHTQIILVDQDARNQRKRENRQRWACLQCKFEPWSATIKKGITTCTIWEYECRETAKIRLFFGGFFPRIKSLKIPPKL